MHRNWSGRILGRISGWHSHVLVVNCPCIKLENVQLQPDRKKNLKIMEGLGIRFFVCFLWRPIYLLEVTGKQGGLVFVKSYRRICQIWQGKTTSRYSQEVVMWVKCGPAGKGLGIKCPHKIHWAQLLSVTVLSCKKCKWLISKEAEPPVECD